MFTLKTTMCKIPKLRMDTSIYGNTSAAVTELLVLMMKKHYQYLVLFIFCLFVRSFFYLCLFVRSFFYLCLFVRSFVVVFF